MRTKVLHHFEEKFFKMKKKMHLLYFLGFDDF